MQRLPQVDFVSLLRRCGPQIELFESVPDVVHGGAIHLVDHVKDLFPVRLLLVLYVLKLHVFSKLLLLIIGLKEEVNSILYAL